MRFNKLNTSLQQSTAELSCRRAFCLSQNMQAATQAISLVGKTLMARPETILSPDGHNHYKLEQLTPAYSRLEEGQEGFHFIHSPMLYVTREYSKDGETYCDAVILNGPISSDETLKDHFKGLPKAFKKYPVFLSADDAFMPSKARTPLCLLVPAPYKKVDKALSRSWSYAFSEFKPFNILYGYEAIKSYLDRCSTSSDLKVLAFRGQISMKKDDLMTHVGLSNLYLASDLSDDVALSPYPESKYIKAFDEAGYSLKDLSSMAQWAKDLKTMARRRLQ